MERRLTAILTADVVGYSRLVEADEAGTLQRLKGLYDGCILPAIPQHAGRLIKLMGDGVLAEFPTAANAVQFAIALQKLLPAHQSGPASERMVFRIGVNFDHVVVEGADVYGDCVNVAARLEGMAEPGGVLISQSAYDACAPNLNDIVFFDNGLRKFKNISRAIRVWSWPRPLPALRAQGKARVFVANFEGNSPQEAAVGVDLADGIKAHFARLTGFETALDSTQAHYRAQGSVRIAVGRSRVLSALVSAESSRQIWAERYDENTDDPFDIVDRCTPRIAMTLRRRIAADDAARLSNKPIDELSFEELLTHAGASFFIPSKVGWRGGGEIAEQALEVEPRSFMALAMAAGGVGLAEFLYGLGKPDDAVAELAFRRIEEALRINARSDMLNAVHALLLLYVRKRHHDAMAAARRSLELNPDYNMGLWTLGTVQVFSGEFDAGVSSSERAANLDIRDPGAHLYSRIAGYGHLGAGRHDQAAAWFLRADQLAPGLPPNLAALVVSRWLVGDSEGARLDLSRLLQEEPGFRIAQMHPPPYRASEPWTSFAATLREAGAPE
jgi:class 3 adenylate cyclase/tetratricopeptide (TPR) repeat protein